MILLLLSLAACTGNHKADAISNAQKGPRLELGITVKPVLSGQCCTDKDKQIEKLLLVTRVNPDSLAHRLGVVTGDLLYTIAGRPVTGISDSYASLQVVDQTQELTLGVFRQNILITLVGEINE